MIKDNNTSVIHFKVTLSLSDFHSIELISMTFGHGVYLVLKLNSY